MSDEKRQRRPVAKYIRKPTSDIRSVSGSKPVPEDDKYLLDHLFNLQMSDGVKSLDNPHQQAHRRSSQRQAWVYHTHAVSNHQYLEHPLLKRIWIHPNFDPFQTPLSSTRNNNKMTVRFSSAFPYTYRGTYRGINDVTITIDTSSSDKMTSDLLRVLLLLEDTTLSELKTRLESSSIALSNDVRSRMINLIDKLKKSTKVSTQYGVERDIQTLLELLSSNILTLTQRPQQQSKSMGQVRHLKQLAQNLITQLGIPSSFQFGKGQQRRGGASQRGQQARGGAGGAGRPEGDKEHRHRFLLDWINDLAKSNVQQAKQWFTKYRQGQGKHLDQFRVSNFMETISTYIPTFQQRLNYIQKIPNPESRDTALSRLLLEPSLPFHMREQIVKKLTDQDLKRQITSLLQERQKHLYPPPQTQDFGDIQLTPLSKKS